MRADRTTAWLAAGVLLGVTAACRPAEPSALQRVADAAVRTMESGTARFAMATSVSGSQFRGARVVRGEGAVDFGEHRYRMAFHLAGFEHTATGPGPEWEIFGDGAALYARMPMMPGDEAWMPIDAEQMGFGGGLALGVGGAVGSDPVVLLQTLHQASDDVAEVGPEPVRGADATRYRFTVDLTTMRPGDADLTDRLRALGMTAVATEVWLDDDGRVRRLAQLLDLSDVDFGSEQRDRYAPRRVVTVVEYHGFGTASPTARLDAPAA